MEEEIRRIFSTHIPEFASGMLEIMSLAYEPGEHLMVAVRARVSSIHPVSVFTGREGAARIKKIRTGLGGVGISVILWDEALERLIAHTILSKGIEESSPTVVIDKNRDKAVVWAEPKSVEYMNARNSLLLRLASQLVGLQIDLREKDRSDNSKNDIF